jgi:hypothetical protein
MLMAAELVLSLEFPEHLRDEFQHHFGIGETLGASLGM